MTCKTEWEDPEMMIVVGFDVRGSSQLATALSKSVAQVYELIHATITKTIILANLEFLSLHIHGDGGYLLASPKSRSRALEFAEGLLRTDVAALNVRFVSAISFGLVTRGTTEFNNSIYPIFAGEPVSAVANVLKTMSGNEIAIDKSISHERHGISVPRVLNGHHFVCYKSYSNEPVVSASVNEAGNANSSVHSDDRYGYLVHLLPPFIDWADRFSDVIPMLQHILGVKSVDIELIGSAGLDNVWSKPILDVMVRIEPENLERAVCTLSEIGMNLVKIDELPDRRLLRRRNSSGDPELHVHLVTPTEWEISRERAFRSALETRQELALAYSSAKRLIHFVTAGDPETYGRLKRTFIIWLEEIQNYLTPDDVLRKDSI